MLAIRRISAVVITLVLFAATVLAQADRAPRKKVRQQQEPAPPVTLVSPPSPEYLSGEASVAVRGNENAIIRLGLAPGGVTLVEFPAADHFFALHPGNSDMVTVDDSPTKARDHFFVFRAGSGFLPPPPGAPVISPSASIIAQMRSGLVVTFLIYPVRELSEMAHRVVVRYNRDEVIASRKLAGLAVNLDEVPQVQPPPASLRIAEMKPADTSTTQQKADNPRPVVILDSLYGQSLSHPSDKKLDIEAEAHKALKAALASSSKIKNWSDPVHGLALAAISSRDLKSDMRLVVVAVRNTLDQPLRILPGHPEITIETRDDKGRPLLIEYVRKVVVESSGTGDPIQGGATVFYAIVFPRPILGARQALRIFVAQAEAADEPAAADLVASRR